MNRTGPSTVALSSGVDVSIMGHDRSRRALRTSTGAVVIIIALPLIWPIGTIAARRAHAIGSDRCWEVS
jgi:uncharacterized membrane protein YhaH (DUF805 family)